MCFIGLYLYLILSLHKLLLMTFLFLYNYISTCTCIKTLCISHMCLCHMQVADEEVRRLYEEAKQCMDNARWFDLVSLMLTSADVILSKVSDKGTVLSMVSLIPFFKQLNGYGGSVWHDCMIHWHVYYLASDVNCVVLMVQSFIFNRSTLI